MWQWLKYGFITSFRSPIIGHPSEPHAMNWIQSVERRYSWWRRLYFGMAWNNFHRLPWSGKATSSDFWHFWNVVRMKSQKNCAIWRRRKANQRKRWENCVNWTFSRIFSRSSIDKSGSGAQRLFIVLDFKRMGSGKILRGSKEVISETDTSILQCIWISTLSWSFCENLERIYHITVQLNIEKAFWKPITWRSWALNFPSSLEMLVRGSSSTTQRRRHQYSLRDT